jgi:hypothetical protein
MTMNARRWIWLLTVIGGGLLVAAVTFLVSTSWGVGGTTTTGPDGRTVVVEFRTPSVLQDSPRLAYGWIAAAIGFVVVVALVIRFGGVVGPALVLFVMWLMVAASIMTIGLFLAPGVGVLGAAAALAIADHARSRPPRGTSALQG